jgi:PTH1 family peptidyl-tRNA hydrolase
MFLFVGLGNIGTEYENTRHNIGFIVVDKIIDKYNFVKSSTRFHSEIWTGNINNEKILISKPQTFMNNSGLAISKIANFYKISLKNIYVFHDDMDILIEKIRFKVGGSAGGHNGIKSIDEMLGKDYNRIRIGVGRPEYKDNVVKFVLGKFTEVEKKLVDDVGNKITENIELLLSNKKDLFLNKINNILPNK